jgi:hypothetical protein
MSELLACPFCGDEAKMFYGEGGYFAYCGSNNRKGMGCVDGPPRATEKDAIAAWNTRRPEPRRREAEQGDVEKLKEAASKAAVALESVDKYFRDIPTADWRVPDGLWTDVESAMIGLYDLAYFISPLTPAKGKEK